MLVQLAIMGMLVACIPLTLVWISSDQNKYRKLIWTIVFLTFDLIMFGAFTRLTDSGLGCPDWPGCYGHSNPFLAHASISEAEALMPTGPVTVMKAWIEMVHRYVAMSIGVLLIILLVASWRNWLKSHRQEKHFSPLMPTLLLLLVCLQGAFGAWTVTMKLQPVIVSIHLLLGMLLLSILVWLGASQNTHQPVGLGKQLILPATLALVLLACQIALGAWVSTNYAALACTDFPLCQGAVIPPMDFEHGFTLWRHLGKTAAGDYLPFSALTAIHWVHRTFAFLVLIVVAWAAIRALKDQGLHKTAKWILIVIAIQFCTGLATIYLDWPLAIAVLHNGGAALLLLLLVMLNYKVRHAPYASAK